MKFQPFIQFNANQHINTNAEILYFDSIILNPSEWYTQYTNIDLTGQTLKLVDCDGVELQDVLFFNDEKYFEFIIQNIYYQQVRLKTTINNIEYLSNYFVCYEEKKTVSIHYKYQDYYQNIRLNGYFTTCDNESNVATYVKETGTKLSGFSTITDYKNFKFDNIDNHTFRALNQALSFPTVYVNLERCTDKPLLKATEEVEGSSNFFASSFKGAIDLDDIHTPSLQIAPPLQLLNSTPNGIYTLTSFINLFELTFNHNVAEQSGQIKLIVETEEESEVPLFVDTINNEVVTLDTPVFTFVNGEYQIFIPENKFNSLYGSNSEIILNFVIQDADFDSNDFNNNDFFTN